MAKKELALEVVSDEATEDPDIVAGRDAAEAMATETLTMELRSYQSVALAGVRSAYRRGKRAPLLCSPTGSGKSAMTKYMLGETKKTVLYLCHRSELMEMIHDDLEREGIPHGVIAGSTGRYRDNYQIHIGMMQTIHNRLGALPKFEWVISDEAHLTMAPTWLAILKHYNESYHLGMSATPCRLDGRGLGEIYDEIVYGPSVRELTDLGYLLPCRVLAPPQVQAGQWAIDPKKSMSEASAILNRPKITGSAIAEFRKLGPGHQAVVFCCDRQHAADVAAQFRAEGFAAANVDGTMDAERERRPLFRDLIARKLDVITNVDLLTTGWDCPQIDVGIDLATTQSLALYLQKIGRVLRIYPGQRQAWWLDHVGSVFRHGLPDAEREWTLDGRIKRAAPPSVRQCPECYSVFAPAPRCPSCGHVFLIVPKKKKLLDSAPGDLAEVFRSDVERREHYLKTASYSVLMKEAKTLQALQDIAKARGYDMAWARRQWGFKVAGAAGAYRRKA